MPDSRHATDDAPLIVDLDADLLHGNLAAERFWAGVREDWRRALVRAGRAGGAGALPDVALLPYDPEVVAEMRAAHAAGRRVELGCEDPALGAAVATHLGTVDAVVPSVPDRRRAPPGPTRPGLPLPLEALRAMRPHQWVKNLLVFLPMVVGHRFDAATFGLSLLAFLSFGLTASAVYLLNDLSDLAADRRHKTKCKRPFAAGRLPLAWGARLVPGLALGGLALALAASPALAGAMLVYAVATTAYSFRLKGTLGADIILLAVLYTLRIIAGAAATGIVPSMWLLSFSIFLFLSLGAVKRLAELVDLAAANGANKAEGRAYQTEDRPVVAMIATSAGFLAVLVLALYIDSAEVRGLYAQPQLLWGICLVLLYWVSRIVLLAHRGKVDQDPVVFAMRDGVSRWVGLAIVILYATAVMV